MKGNSKTGIEMEISVLKKKIKNARRKGARPSCTHGGIPDATNDDQSDRQHRGEVKEKDAVVVVKKKKKKEVVVVLFTAHGRVSNAAQEQSHPKNHKECERKTKTQKFFYFSPFFKL
jgi:hypothetical protein